MSDVLIAKAHRDMLFELRGFLLAQASFTARPPGLLGNKPIPGSPWNGWAESLGGAIRLVDKQIEALEAQP